MNKQITNLKLLYFITIFSSFKVVEGESLSF